MERDKNLPLSPITTRLIALRKPAGAAEALLAYLPYADEDAILGEVQLGSQRGDLSRTASPIPLVVRALADPQPRGGRAAAEALCLCGDREQRRPSAKCCTTPIRPFASRRPWPWPAPGARRRARPHRPHRRDGRRCSRRRPRIICNALAGGSAAGRTCQPGDDDDHRKKRRTPGPSGGRPTATHVALVDRYPPTALERYHGYTLLVLANTNSVVELGTDRKVRWQLNGLLNPHDVQVLGPDRILVAEYNGQRVTERNRRGEVLWQKQVAGAVR